MHLNLCTKRCHVAAQHRYIRGYTAVYTIWYTIWYTSITYSYLRSVLPRVYVLLLVIDAGVCCRRLQLGMNISRHKTECASKTLTGSNAAVRMSVTVSAARRT